MQMEERPFSLVAVKFRDLRKATKNKQLLIFELEISPFFQRERKKRLTSTSRNKKITSFKKS